MIIRRTKIALVNVFAEFGQLEFLRRKRRLQRSAALVLAPIAQEPRLERALAAAGLRPGGAGGSAGLGSRRALASAAFVRPAPFSTVKMTWPTLICRLLLREFLVWCR